MPTNTRKKPEKPSSPLPERPTAVCGLDTASDRLHFWCDVWPSPGLYLKVHTSSKGPGPDERRQSLCDFSAAVFARMQPGTAVFCEEPLALKNGKTTRILALAAGAVWAQHLGHSLYWFWVDVAHWKKQVIGNGNANKAQVREWAIENMDLSPDMDGDREDFYDAAALCRYGEMVLNDLYPDRTTA